MTIVEKILARASGRASVAPGDYLEVSPNGVTVIAPVFKMIAGLQRHMRWGLPLFNPEKVMIVDGHLGATASHAAAESREAHWEWAKHMGVPEQNIFRLGRSGVENMFAAEQCWALPGDVYFQGINGHSSTCGALGAFASTLSDEKDAYLIKGKTWIKVPRTVRVNVIGKPPLGVLPRDISEALLREIGPTGAVGSVIEWGGEYIHELCMDGRLAICSQALFCGAWTAIINPDSKTFEYIAGRTDATFDPLVSDDNALYWKTVSIDVTKLKPLIVVPPTRFDIREIDNVAGTPISKGFIGSDAGGWLDDLRIAAQVLKGKKIKHDIVLNITPCTVEILKGALREGLLEIFFDAECVVPTPNEGMECGFNTPLESNDVCIATGQTNFPGRMGSPTAEIYLSNAAVVAASCLEGKIADPRPYLK